VVPRYRRLAERGQCELSVTPYGHPIVPLLLDFQSAREAVPTMPLPQHASYPGGSERAAWHVEEGLRVFMRAFGVRPAGCWPSEGAISRGTLELLDRTGFKWAASSTNVLRGSLSLTNAEVASDPLALQPALSVARHLDEHFFFAMMHCRISSASPTQPGMVTMRPITWSMKSPSWRTGMQILPITPS